MNRAVGELPESTGSRVPGDRGAAVNPPGFRLVSAPEVGIARPDHAVPRHGVSRQPKPFIARFEVQYAPGELVAVASTAGKEQARTVLMTANDSLRVHAAADRTVIRADDTDLALDDQADVEYGSGSRLRLETNA